MVFLFAAAGSDQDLILGLIEHDGPGRAFCHAYPAGLAIPDINDRDTFSIYLGDLPWADPDTGEAGYALVAFNPRGLPLVKDILVGNVALRICHVPERLHYLGKTDILGTDKNTASALGTIPEQVRLQQSLLLSHPHHVKDLAGIKVGNRLTDRTDTAACTTGKATVEVLPALGFRYLGIKGRGDFLGRHRHKKPLFCNNI